MVPMARKALVVAGTVVGLLVAAPAPAGEGEYPVRPYVDPNMLDVPWPKHSHYRQPWRGYLQTRPAEGFLRGVGVAYNVKGNHELAMRLVAETGFRALRLEIGWGGFAWQEDRFAGGDRIRAVLEACKRYGIRPTLLINAHQGVPCPVRFFQRTLASAAPAGSREVRLTDVGDLVPGRSGLSNLSNYWAAEALITKIDADTGTCTLSKPLPKALEKGARVPMATLKYVPFHPLGHAAFDDTAAGWVRYALAVCDLAAEAGLEAWDVEIWNELTFGTKFLRINNYYEPDIAPPPGRREPDFLKPHGHCWELARRTVEAVKARYRRVRCIWGFSNTTFFHCPVEKLPPRTDGQSYHPYGTGTRSLPKREQHAGRPELNVEGYVPTIDIRMPEGWAHTFVQTESLIRLINPRARQRTPAETRRFYHYITEHGAVPGEAGVRGEQAEWRYKTKCALRSYCMWLNKGIDVMHYYCAWGKSPAAMGLLPPGLGALPADAKFREVATPPMRAIRNLTRAFAGAERIENPRQLTVEVTALGAPREVFAGDGDHRPLWQREVFAALPFQLRRGRFAVACYVMTYDATKPFRPRRHRLTVGNLPGAAGEVSLYDPMTDEAVDVRVVSRGKGEVTVAFDATDTPRLLMLGK